MNAKNQFFRTAGLMAGALLLCTGRVAAASTEADALPTFDESYIRFSAGGLENRGTDAAAQARAQIPRMGSAGIEAFRYVKELSKETSLEMNGQALPGAEDYLAQFKVTKNEVGSFEMGYKTFRTFYDGAGGFFPVNNAWLPIQPRKLYVDRGNFFVNATIAMPKAPVYTFKYNNATRTGRKDSTIWGDTDMTGVPIWSVSALNPVSANRKILPSYIDLDERQETFEASVRHAVGNTTGTLAFVVNRIDNSDTRKLDRYTGELRPYPFPFTSASAVLIPSNLNSNAVWGSDTQNFEEKSWAVSGKFETAFNEHLKLFGGLIYREADIDISASRLNYSTINSLTGSATGLGYYATGGRPPYTYTSSGSLKQDTLTGNLGLRVAPLANLHVDFAVRGENLKTSGTNIANYVNNNVALATGVITAWPVNNAVNTLNLSEKPWTPEVEFRYTGIRKLSLYGSWDYRSTSQDERTSTQGVSVSTTANTVTLAAVSTSLADVKEKHSNLKLGANWTASQFFTARAEAFTKDHENRFSGYGTSAGSLYVLNYDIYGARLSAIVKPLAMVTSTTRYVVQRGKAGTIGNVYSSTSGDSRRYQISETIDWNPTRSFYTQLNANLVYDTIVTSEPYVTGASKIVVYNADNNYWNGHALCGFVVDKDTNAEVQFTYYRADNYVPAQSIGTIPYGMGAKDYTLAFGVKHRFSDRWVGNAKVGYTDSRNDTAGGNSDYRGPLGYFSVDYKL